MPFMMITALKAHFRWLECFAAEISCRERILELVKDQVDERFGDHSSGCRRKLAGALENARRLPNCR
jgi:hypothetical protein